MLGLRKHHRGSFRKSVRFEHRYSHTLHKRICTAMYRCYYLYRHALQERNQGEREFMKCEFILCTNRWNRLSYTISGYSGPYQIRGDTPLAKGGKEGGLQNNKGCF